MKETVVKGLMFNLLESLAREAGCSEEAWELVAEFAAADLADAGSLRLWGSDVCPTNAFEVPAEAMLSCLTRESRGDQSLNLVAASKRKKLLGVDPAPDSQPDLYDAIPKDAIGGFGPQAFCQSAGEWELSLPGGECRAEATDDDDSDWDELQDRRFVYRDPEER